MKEKLIAKLLLIVIAVAIISAFIIYTNLSQYQTPSALNTTIMEVNSSVLNLEIARSEKELSDGLMFRTSMDNNKGMIFIFQDEQIRTFWMKNTLISLDIIYLDKEFNVVKIYSNTKTNQIKEIYSSLKPSQYAIELNGGRSAELGITEGLKLNINL